MFIYCASTALVVAGAWFGYDYLRRQDYAGFPGFAVTQPPPSRLGCFANWDGVWYRDIAERGYSYSGHEGSYVIFFPGYPCVAAAVSILTSLDATWSLLLVSHLSFFFSLCILRRYLQARFPDADAGVVWLTLLAFAFSPMSFFFRMAYAESLFALLVLLTLYGVHRGWPVWSVALMAGAATSVRFVGIALVPVLAMYLWERRASTGERDAFQWLLLPIGVWGVHAYMWYLSEKFGDPLICFNNHVFFNDRSRVSDPALPRLGRLLILEPIWSTYVPGNPRYWASAPDSINPLFSLRFMDPLFFSATAAVVAFGAWTKQLNRYELVTSVSLLVIPYVSKGYDNAMRGHARYALVVVPAFWVIGRLLHSAPYEVRFCIIAASAAYMTIWSALFAAWHIVI
jgi:hypothetical protein